MIDQLNRKIESIGRTEHVEVLPFHDSLEDPTTLGTMRPKWTADGIHPSVEGYRRLGQLAFRPPGGATGEGGEPLAEERGEG